MTQLKWVSCLVRDMVSCGCGKHRHIVPFPSGRSSWRKMSRSPPLPGLPNPIQRSGTLPPVAASEKSDPEPGTTAPTELSQFPVLKHIIRYRCSGQ